MSNKKNVLCFEMLNNEDLKVQVEGNTDDLSSMIASAIIQSEELDHLFRVAMMKVVMKINEQEESEDSYIEQLIKNGVTAQA